jgi:hypothetical protein
MQRAFPPQPVNLEKKKTQGAAAASIKACRPQSEVDYIVYILMLWQVGIRLTDLNPGTERDRLKLFRRKHHNGPKITGKYCLEQIQVPREEPRIVLRRRELDKDGKKDAGRIVVSREQVFYAIDEWHQGHAHMGQERMWTYCRSKYFNITQRLVRIYCKTCVACSKKNPVGNKQKGSRKPIMLLNWGSRFEPDLMDFHKLRKRDQFGVLMRWILTLKDHVTSLVYLCTLPRKRANLIAYKLQEIFGIIGYPMIFHTDNGKEFTAMVVLEFHRYLNPNILMVTGRQCHPSDQGSVENMNKCVKRTLGTVLAEYRLVGKDRNWTEVLGSVASAINLQHSRGKYDISAYEAVYGQKMDHDFSCSKEEVHRCWRVPEWLKVINDPEFTEYARENYIIDDDKICDDDAEGYFSDGSSPSDEKEEVSDEYFFDHLQDDITEDNDVKGKGYNPFNKFDAESNDDFIDPVRDVLAVSDDEGPEQSIQKTLSKKKLAKITTSDFPMNQRKSPP